jgi:CDP-diacylglycerol--glycerol-3-phosphate 3-phosphatidyltransferase
MKRQFPNILTLVRGGATVMIIVLFLTDFDQKHLLIYLLFIFAALTDFFDGFFARKWKVVSELGTIFDPLFDKLLVLSLLLLIFPLQIINPAIIVILFVRDIVVDALRSFMLSKNIVVPAIKTAKLKTASQMTMLHFVLLLLLVPSFVFAREIAVFFSIVATIFSLWSAFIYVKKFLIFIKKIS